MNSKMKENDFVDSLPPDICASHASSHPSGMFGRTFIYIGNKNIEWSSYLGKGLHDNKMILKCEVPNSLGNIVSLV